MQDSRDAQKPSDAKARTPSKTAVFSLPNDLYAAGSPVILASNSLLKDRQTDAMSVRVALQNIGPKPIIAAQICIRPMDAAGRVLGKDIPCHYLDLNVKTGERFGGNKEFSLPDSTTREISVEVAEVIFSDKTVWQSEEEPWEPLPAPEPLTRRLGDPELVKQYRIRFGNASEIWPRAHKDLWLCTCGTWNREDRCYRCQRERAALLALDPEELMAEKDARLAREKAEREAKEAAQRAAAEKAAETAAREAAAKAEAEKRKRRNRRIALAFALLVALGFGIGFLWTMVTQHNRQYDAAVALYNAGQYEEAISAFTALDGYKDSAAQIKICETAIKDAAYDAAAALHNAGKYEEAIAAFEALNGYKDSAAKIDEIKHSIEWMKACPIGETVYFGSYEQDNNTANGMEDIEWIVLAKEGKKVLVISKYALDCQKYNSTDTEVTWETCSLRKWLNGTFLNAAFRSAEQNSIVSSTVTADKNPSYSTSPGKKTIDKVLLLSITEVNKYFSSNNARQCRGTAYCNAQGAIKASNGKCWWWLRSPGDDSNYAAVVSSGGSVDNCGFGVDYNRIAVRPALWIDLG